MDEKEHTGWVLPGSDDTPIARIMRRAVFCVRPEQGLDEAARLLVEKSIGGAPVVDNRGKLLGILSKTDVIRSRYQGGGAGTVPNVGEVMTPVAFTAPEDATVLQVADVMMRAGIHRVVVVDALHRVTGIVSSLDVIRWVATQGA